MKETKKDQCLPLLGVYVGRTDIGFETSVFRNLTFTDQYLSWVSYISHKRIISPIPTLAHQALTICTKR